MVARTVWHPDDRVEQIPRQPKGNRCFGGRRPSGDATLSSPVQLHLDDDTASALADLLPVLGCGEEAAALAFSALADDRALASTKREQLRQIAHDERVHDAIIEGLRRALPAVAPAPAQSAAARRFHYSLRAGGADLHLARIAALDAGVCTILSCLLRPCRPLAREATVAAALRRIRRDEARHVAIARAIALERSPAARLREAAAVARVGLAALVADHGPALERLGVDAHSLARTLARLPDGLLV